MFTGYCLSENLEDSEKVDESLSRTKRDLEAAETGYGAGGAGGGFIKKGATVRNILLHLMLISYLILFFLICTPYLKGCWRSRRL